jgi:hypothetical protein
MPPGRCSSAAAEEREADVLYGAAQESNLPSRGLLRLELPDALARQVELVADRLT